MADLEHFGAQEQGETDPQAVERMRERMRANAAQIKKLKKDEGKQHKKEKDLAQIIVQYLQSQQKREIMLLVVRCLKQNIPPVIVLSILLLSEPKIAQKQGIEISDSEDHSTQYTNALTKIGVGQSALPLKARILFNNWIENLKDTSLEKGAIVSITMREPDERIKIVAIQLTSFVIREFLSSHQVEIDFKKIQVFANFILNGICKKVEKLSSTNPDTQPSEEENSDQENDPKDESSHE